MYNNCDNGSSPPPRLLCAYGLFFPGPGYLSGVGEGAGTDEREAGTTAILLIVSILLSDGSMTSERRPANYDGDFLVSS